MTSITASPEALMRQASMTAHEYLMEARQRIDREFGEGYAVAHPELVGSFMQAAALDFHASATAQATGKAAEHLGYALEKIADAIEGGK